MDHYGIVPASSTLYIPFTTHDTDGAAVAPNSAFEAADVRIYKNGSATQRSSEAGYTMTSPFDSVTGLHMLAIDLSDNTDAGFYAAGSRYSVVLVPDETVDGFAVVRVLADFSIGPPAVNVSEFGGTAGTFASGIPETKVASIAANAITATAIAADAITDAKVASDVTIASVTGAVGSVTGAVGSVTGNVGGSVASIATGGITAASFAANAINASKLDPDVTTELQAGLATAADLAIVDGIVDDILLDTAEIGTAGAGLTNINLPNQTMDIVGNITGNLSGSVGSVTGAVGSVTGAVGSVTGNVGGNVTGSIGSLAAQAKADVNAEADTALADIHLDHLLATEYDPQSKPGAAGALLNELVESDDASPARARFTAEALEEAPTGGSAPTAAAIADAVWEEAIADHSGTAGSTAEQLAAAGSAGDPWATALPGAYTSGQAGKIVGDNLNATVSSRATQASVDTVDGIVDAILIDTAEIGVAGAGLTAADDAVLAAIAALNNLSQANIRTAIGLASANLDTQLDALPTNAELATALAAADDAVLAAIAALNNLSQANIRTAVGLASANLDTQLDALPTNAELATALAAADDAVLAAIAALNNLSAAQVNAEVVDALAVDTYAEPAAVPAATATLAAKINWLATLARNKVTQTATTQTLRNDADSGNIATAGVSDDSTTFTRNEWV